MPLDTPVLCPSGDIERVSAGKIFFLFIFNKRTTFIHIPIIFLIYVGNTVHEMSSSSCIDSLFRFIEGRYRNIHDTAKA